MREEILSALLQGFYFDRRDVGVSSIWGNKIKISLFGESHGEAIGVILDGLPSGKNIDKAALETFMKRRAPGNFPWTTKRKEADRPQILSGIYNEKTTGTPLCAIIINEDTKSKDYLALSKVPRPGHADLTAFARYSGYQDPRGGGHFSGRITAALTFAGALCIQLLSSRGIRIYGHILSIKEIREDSFSSKAQDLLNYSGLSGSSFPVMDETCKEKMIQEIMLAKQQGDSCGGVVECMAIGVPAGIGDPFFDGLESVIASILFSVPAVKGVEFGSGFGSTLLYGSENNDPIRFSENGKSIIRESNHAGGLEGGISNGMPILCRVGFKPTPSISKLQRSIDLESLKNTDLSITGRHDPCIVPRAVPVVESAMAIALLDSILNSPFQEETK
jgi:chorismate synthase